MLKSTEQHMFNNMNSVSHKYMLGQKLNEKLGVVKGKYRFDSQGGVAGYITLLNDHNDAVKLPSGAILLHSFINVIQELQPSGGTPALSLGMQADGDLKAAITPTVGLQDGIQVNSAATAVLLTAERTLRLKVTGANLTQGKFDAFVTFVLSE